MLEDRIKQYTEAHAYNEEARGKLGQILADLPISDHGRLEFYRPGEGWGVEVYWHTPKNVVFSAHNLRPHICTEDCDRMCDAEWDRKPITVNDLSSAIDQLFIEHITELERGTAVINTAIAMFLLPKADRTGIGQLKAVMRAYEGSR